MATRQPNYPTQTPTSRPPGMAPAARNSPNTATAVTKPGMSKAVATAKRKADGGDSGPPPKSAKIAQPQQKPTATANAKSSTPGSTASVPYRGTARSDAPSNTAKPAARPVQKPGNTGAPAPAPSASASSAPAPKKGGFASVLARAKAAQEANKASAANTIKHTPREKPPKISRSKMQQEAMEKQQSAGKNGKMPAQAVKGKNGIQTNGKPGLQQKKGPAEVGYKGTMRKGPAPIAYKGTMRAVDASKPARAPSPVDRFGGKAKNGGYADWSDLSDAEEEPEPEDYSDSDDMEGGFDEMEKEEAEAAKVARREDQLALEEEERHRKEKLERKRKFEAMNKQAAGRKKF